MREYENLYALPVTITSLGATVGFLLWVKVQQQIERIPNLRFLVCHIIDLEKHILPFDSDSFGSSLLGAFDPF